MISPSIVAPPMETLSMHRQAGACRPSAAWSGRLGLRSVKNQIDLGALIGAAAGEGAADRPGQVLALEVDVALAQFFGVLRSGRRRW
jgi:hypothetical protein